MTFWRRIAQGIDQLNEWSGRGVSWLSTVLVLLVCFDVISRYLFNRSAAWMMELEWHLFALIFLLGAGYAFRHDRHVRVDLFYARFTDREKAQVNLIGDIFFLIPWCLLVIYTTYEYALESYLIGETSPDPGGLPARYVIKFAVVAGAVLLLLQAVSDIIHAVNIFRGKEPPSRENPEHLQEKL